MPIHRANDELEDVGRERKSLLQQEQPSLNIAIDN
jgi:hypothetical protein